MDRYRFAAPAPEAAGGAEAPTESGAPALPAALTDRNAPIDELRLRLIPLTVGASSVDFICRPWARSGDYWTVYWDLTRQVKEAFDAAGISIPFPQTDMHIHVRGDAPSPFPPPATRPPVASETVGSTPAERYAAGDDAEDDAGEDTSGR